MNNEDSAVTSIIVPDSHHYEVIIDHCLTNTDSISACDESRVEKKGYEKEGKVKGMGETHFSKIHGSNQVVDLSITANNKEPNEGKLIHKPREEGEIVKHKLEGINPLIFHDDPMISNDGILQEDKVEKSDLQDDEERLKGEAQLSKDDWRYEHNSDLLFPTMLFQIYGHEKIVEGNDIGANVMLRSTSQQIGSLHDDTGDGTSDLHKVHGPRLWGDLVEGHAVEEGVFPNDNNYFQISRNFRTTAYGKPYNVSLDHDKSLWHHYLSLPCAGDHNFANE
ncbi:hypothetical protein KI387_002348, partial [Taxus chinensis]